MTVSRTPHEATGIETQCGQSRIAQIRWDVKGRVRLSRCEGDYTRSSSAVAIYDADDYRQNADVTRHAGANECSTYRRCVAIACPEPSVGGAASPRPIARSGHRGLAQVAEPSRWRGQPR